MAKFLRSITIVIACIFGILIGFPTIQYTFYFVTGRYIGSGARFPSEVSQYIVNHSLDAAECGKMVMHPFEIFRYPSITSLRRSCIDGVAFSRQDPSICASLMPSDFGLSCIWEIVDSLSEGNNCSGFENGDIICFDSQDRKYSSPTCLDLPVDSIVEDLCFLEYAVQHHDFSACDQIASEKFQSACKIAVQNTHSYLSGSST